VSVTNHVLSGGHATVGRQGHCRCVEAAQAQAVPDRSGAFGRLAGAGSATQQADQQDPVVVGQERVADLDQPVVPSQDGVRADPGRALVGVVEGQVVEAGGAALGVQQLRCPLGRQLQDDRGTASLDAAHTGCLSAQGYRATHDMGQHR
jgi:hypothetical protein